MITSLQLENFRSITKLDLSFPLVDSAERGSVILASPTVLFFGANAQGKTSLLEGLHLLLTGRSFRTTVLDQLIGVGGEGLLARGTVLLTGEHHRAEHRLGVQKRKKSKLQVSLDGSAVRSSMSLARMLPVQVVDHQSLQLVLGEPSVRRRFIDWGAFHVEPGYGLLLKKWQSALSQRNSVLKTLKRGSQQTGESELQAWTQIYASLSVQVARARQRYFELFSAYLTVLHDGKPSLHLRTGTTDFGIPGLQSFEIQLKHGFPFDADQSDAELSSKFVEELGEKRESEIVLGRTHSGPQRAEVSMHADGQVAKDVLSRGQCKLVAAFLLLHQVQHLRRCNDAGHAVVLVDDLTAELDNDRAADLLVKLSGACSQLFVTALAAKTEDLPEFIKALKDSSSFSMFHVEHGQAWVSY